MSFPVFRSRAFWFGVPGLLFLLWAWADSTRIYTGISEKSPWGSFSFEHWNSAITVSRAPAGSPSAFPSWAWRGSFGTKNPEPRIWWATLKAERDRAGRPFVQVPHWLLVSSYAAVWSLVLLARRHHWRKARQAHSAQFTSS